MVKKLYGSNNSIIAFLTLLIAFTSCRRDSVPEIKNVQREEVLHLNNKLEAQVKLQEIMGVVSTELIPLQMHFDGLLSGNIPKKILYHEPWFIIMDQVNEPIQVFKQNGEFYASFGTKGKGPNEMLSSIDMAIPIDKDTLFVLDYMASKIILYNILTKGEAIKSIALKNDLLSQYSFGRGSLAVYDGQILILGKKRSSSTSVEILVLDSNKALDNVISFYDQIAHNNRSNRDGIFVHSGHDLVYLSNYSDSIRYLKNQTFVPGYVIPLPNTYLDNQSNQIGNIRLEYKYYLDSSRFLYVTFFVGSIKYIYIYNKGTGQGKLINTLENGIISNVEIPISDFFHFRDSVLYGYLGHVGVLSRYESIINLINGNVPVEVPEELVFKLKKEISILEKAISFGNGLIVKYIVEFEDEGS